MVVYPKAHMAAAITIHIMCAAAISVQVSCMIVVDIMTVAVIHVIIGITAIVIMVIVIAVLIIKDPTVLLRHGLKDRVRQGKQSNSSARREQKNNGQEGRKSKDLEEVMELEAL